MSFGALLDGVQGLAEMHAQLLHVWRIVGARRRLQGTRSALHEGVIMADCLLITQITRTHELMNRNTAGWRCFSFVGFDHDPSFVARRDRFMVS